MRMKTFLLIHSIIIMYIHAKINIISQKTNENSQIHIHFDKIQMTGLYLIMYHEIILAASEG